MWIVVALLSGLGLGYVLWHQDPAAGGSALGMTRTPDAREPDTATPDKPPPLTTEAPPAAPTPRVPTLEVRTGHGTIHGHVTDQDGAPVADVLMTAVPNDFPRAARRQPGGAPAPEKTFEEDLAEVAARLRYIHAGRREARTDATGTYAIEGLAEGAYRIEAAREGYTLRAKRGSNTWNAKPGATVDFVGEAIIVVQVEVLGPDGRPATNVRLSSSTDAENREGRRAYAWTPERTTIEVPPGTHWFRATAGEDGELKAPAQTLTATAGAPMPTLTLRLVGRPGLKGKLTFPEKLGGMRLEVKALKFDGDTPPEAAAVLESRGAERGRFDRRDAGYSFRDIESGRYLLVVSYDGNRPDLSRVVDIGGSVAHVDIEMPSVDRTYYRIVRVLDEKEEPVAGVQFGLQLRAPTLSASGWASSMRREDGSYYVGYALGGGGRSLPAWTPGATLTLSVSTRKRGAVERTIDPKDHSDLVVHLGGAATLDLTIEGFAKSGLVGKARVYVKARLAEDGMGFSGEGVPVTAEGRVHVIRQQAGARIAVLVGPGSPMTQVMVFRLRLDAGENRRTVRLPRLHDVRVEGTTSVTLKRLDPAGAWIQQYGRAKESPVVLHFVPPGRYEATLFGAGAASKKIVFDVPAQTVIRAN